MLRISPTHLPPLTPDLGAYESEALQFCYDWQSGRENFTLHTSGSTGHPKPVVLTRRQMQASAQMTGRTLGLWNGGRALVCLNTHYIAGIMMLVRGLELGLEMTLVPPNRNPLATFEAGISFDFTALVPLQMQTILQESPEKIAVLNRMKAILVGGAPVSYGLENALQRIEAPIYSTYGMTETVSHIALRRLNGPARTETYTVLEDVEIGLDTRGCLWVVAPVTNNQRVQTNDLVALENARTFRWLGRIDNVINSGGVKISLEKIERALEKALNFLQMAHRFVAFALPHPVLGEELCVAFEGKSFTVPEENRVKKILIDTLERYEIPKRFFYVTHFPETPTGKTDRLAISTMVAQLTIDQ